MKKIIAVLVLPLIAATALTASAQDSTQTWRIPEPATRRCR